MRSLLPTRDFAVVFEPLIGKRIGWVRSIGNVGDGLIDWATQQLLDEYGISWRLVEPDSPGTLDVDELVFSGGGSMGTHYMNNWQRRGAMLRLGLPVTILPQSFMTPEDRSYHRVYVRERGSLAHCANATLAPDLALGFRWPDLKPPTRAAGVFLRRDRERTTRLRWFRRDPARLCATPLEYLELAADHEHVVTDRLHFAICALLAGRRATLLDNNYHKNRSMHETWLEALGCRFAGSVRDALRGSRSRAA